MRKTIQKTQVKYLVDLITHHIEAIPDDISIWIQHLKLAYQLLVTLDNMGEFEYDHKLTVYTLDLIYENLRNEFNRHDLYFPDNKKYYD